MTEEDGIELDELELGKSELEFGKFELDELEFGKSELDELTLGKSELDEFGREDVPKAASEALFPAPVGF